MSFFKVALGATGVLFAVLLTAGQFTTISTGENGLYTGFDGQVKDEVLAPGIKYDGFGTIKVFNTRKIIVTASDLRPKTSNNTVMKDVDVTVTYSIDPGSLFEFYTGYDRSNHGVTEDGQIRLMANYVSRLITSAVNKSFDEYAALEVNSRLDPIQDDIKGNLVKALEKDKLNGRILIDSVIVGKADLPDDLVSSVNRVVAAESAKREQQVKTETAQLKAEENRALASTVTSQSLEYQRNEILKAAFANGSIQKMVIINGAKMDFLPGGLTGK